MVNQKQTYKKKNSYRNWVVFREVSISPAIDGKDSRRSLPLGLEGMFFLLKKQEGPLLSTALFPASQLRVIYNQSDRQKHLFHKKHRL